VHAALVSLSCLQPAGAALQVRELCGLPIGGSKPVLAVLDVEASQRYRFDTDEELTEQSVRSFVADYRAGQLLPESLK